MLRDFNGLVIAGEWLFLKAIAENRSMGQQLFIAQSYRQWWL